ncbi:hypothetical protein CFRS1_v015126 [Colletotrichum fructicola]|nr:hypothetical protein CFRS1_v015126 [Colletotrichum fructicola]
MARVHNWSQSSQSALFSMLPLDFTRHYAHVGFGIQSPPYHITQHQGPLVDYLVPLGYPHPENLPSTWEEFEQDHVNPLVHGTCSGTTNCKEEFFSYFDGSFCMLIVRVWSVVLDQNGLSDLHSRPPQIPPNVISNDVFRVFELDYRLPGLRASYPDTTIPAVMQPSLLLEQEQGAPWHCGAASTTECQLDLIQDIAGSYAHSLSQYGSGPPTLLRGTTASGRQYDFLQSKRVESPTSDV